MRGLVLAGTRRIELRDDLPEPVVADPGDAVVEVEAAGLCGSDLHPWAGREPAATGVVQGHEAVGRVVEVGPDVTTVAAGDRVVVPFTTSCGTCGPCTDGLSSRCTSSRLFGWGAPGQPAAAALHGGQAERLRIPHADGTLLVVPDDLDPATALLLCDNAPTGWYVARRAEVRPGTRVAVVGCGAVGLCAVAAALDLGAVEVVAIEPEAARRAAAVEVGATTAVAPDEAEDLGTFDAVIEAAGPIDAQALAARLAGIGATIAIAAVQTADRFGVDPVLAYDRNLTVRAGRAPVRSILDELFPRVLDGSVLLPTDAVMTERGVDLVDGPRAYARFAAREDGLVKLAFAP